MNSICEISIPQGWKKPSANSTQEGLVFFNTILYSNFIFIFTPNICVTYYHIIFLIVYTQIIFKIFDTDKTNYIIGKYKWYGFVDEYSASNEALSQVIITYEECLLLFTLYIKFCVTHITFSFFFSFKYCSVIL